MRLLAERFVFGGDDRFFFNEGVNTLGFTSIVYVYIYMGLQQNNRFSVLLGTEIADDVFV